MARQGNDFHRLIEILEKVISGSPGITIESSKMLDDRVTGQKREHDIVLTYTYPNRTCRIGIECRDRSRKVGVSQIEEFHQKCLHTGIDKGVIVTSRGFAKTALKKAKFHGIDCLSLEQVEQLDWCLMQGFYQYRRDVTKSHIQFDIDPAHKEKLTAGFETDFEIFERMPDGNTVQITRDSSNRLVESALSAYTEFGEDGQERTIIVRDENASNFFMSDKLGNQVPIACMTFTISYKTTVSRTDVRYYKYGHTADGKVHSVAMADVDLGNNRKGEFVLFKGDDEIQLHFVPQKVALPKSVKSKAKRDKN